jgi:hypothetical protein
MGGDAQRQRVAEKRRRDDSGHRREALVTLLSIVLPNHRTNFIRSVRLMDQRLNVWLLETRHTVARRISRCFHWSLAMSVALELRPASRLTLHACKNGVRRLALTLTL